MSYEIRKKLRGNEVTKGCVRRNEEYGMRNDGGIRGLKWVIKWVIPNTL